MKLPLEGIKVLEFSQYMAGPYAGLRLADLGAQVIKIERPKYGDACRQLATKNMWADGDTVLFHTVNRNKSSFVADLKNPQDVETVKALISKVDVITHNFRPGIMARLGLDYETVKSINPGLIYGEVSGYGDIGPWRDKPGQDLLAQSMSGLTCLSGNKDQNPVPFGVAVADMLCGTHLSQGILAALVRKKRTGKGCKIEASLMESAMDFQFEGLTAYLNNSDYLPVRSQVSNAHAYLGAPYGIYATRDGFIALAMGEMEKLDKALNDSRLTLWISGDLYFTHRDEVKSVIAEILKGKDSEYWLARLEAVGFWCSDVYDYAKLAQSDAYLSLNMEQVIARNESTQIRTTRCPIRINGNILTSSKAAPRLGSALLYYLDVVSAQLEVQFQS